MKIRGRVVRAFDLRTCVGCDWYRIDIDGMYDPENGEEDRLAEYGFVVDVEHRQDIEFFAINNWRKCRLVGIKYAGIWIKETKGSKAINNISECWFEKIWGHGIYLGGGVQRFHIADTYFALCGTDPGVGDASADFRKYDVYIRRTLSHRPLVVISNCSFMRGDSEDHTNSHRRRIRVEGESQVDVRNCKFLLHHPNQRCVELVNAEQANLFDNNIVLVDDTDTAEYQELLYSITDGNPIVNWRSRYHLPARGVEGTETTLYSTIRVRYCLGVGNWEDEEPTGRPTRRFEVFDENGNLLGCVPVYPVDRVG